jgi:hypothetical protein
VDALHSALAEQGAAMQAAVQQALQTLTPALQAFTLLGQAPPLAPCRPTAAPVRPLQGALTQAAVQHALQALEAVVVASAPPEMPAIGLPAPDQPPASLNPQPKVSAQHDMLGQQVLQALLPEPARDDRPLATVTHMPAPPNDADAVSGSRMHQHDSERHLVRGSQTISKQGHEAAVHEGAELNGPTTVTPIRAQQWASPQKTSVTASPQRDVALLQPSTQPAPATQPGESGGWTNGAEIRGAVVITYSRTKGKRRAPAQAHSCQPHDASSAADMKRRRLDDAGTRKGRAAQSAGAEAAARKETAAVPAGPLALAKATTQRNVDKRMASKESDTLQVVRQLTRSCCDAASRERVTGISTSFGLYSRMRISERMVELHRGAA